MKKTHELGIFMLGVIFVVLAGVLWAVDTLIRYPLLFSGVFAGRIVFTEHLFLSIIFLPFLLKDFRKIGDIKLSTIFYLIIVGVFGSAIGTLTFTKAFMLINPSLVILLQKLQPVIAISLAHVFLGERIKKEFLLWALVALVGGVLISSPDILPGLGELDFSLSLLSSNALWGYSLSLIAVMSWGASTVFGKKLSAQGLDEIHIMGWRFVFGFLFMVFYMHQRLEGPAFDWNMITYGKLFLMVVLSGIGGMYFYYRGLKLLSARACALAEMFFPFSAVIINWMVLDAKLLPVQIAGGVMILLSSTIIQLKKY